ncbi:MAG TPA: hypothetical protein VL202_12890 [Pararhizobium sp.]|uniref:hypothetical protein n=1 Tax=Pararhizobium sp. TaxID=1977563 RepID=UPI002B84A465|nr:hypothetical protein [Pararhizobium sp.]HTO32058.1 hypothetical protein [Pararhizobium sp.]
MAIRNVFPDDVWNAAVKARTSVSEEYFEDHSAIVIARAILAERNRCADLMARKDADRQMFVSSEIALR